jgi:hypothetical protein
MWLACLALLSLPALAQEPADSRAAELAKLRREVETVSNDLLLRKEDLRNKLKAIEAQKLEIEVQIRREELRLAQLQGEAESRRSELAVHQSGGSALTPTLLEAIAHIRGIVAAGLPFHQVDRLGELDTLKEQVERGLVAPEAGVARLWAFTEDELRLARENGLDRQVVPLASGEVLADVARIGMVALYFRTDGGEVGSAVKDASGWRWVTFDAREDQLGVLELMEKMQHGVRTGSFTLPNPASGAP